MVPELANRAAAELEPLRATADAVVRDLLAHAQGRIVVVGAQDPGRASAQDPGRASAQDRSAAASDPPSAQDTAARRGYAPAPVSYRPPLDASFRPWGGTIDIHLPARPDRTGAASPGGDRVGAAATGGPASRLPLSLTVAAWLLARNGLDTETAETTVDMIAVPADAAPTDCHRWGRELAAQGPAALLVMGDGSACRGLSAPGYHDDRAEPFDDQIAAALAAADQQALAALDPQLAVELQVAGRAPWQVAAAAAATTTGKWAGRVDYYAAPYGVAYFVASWQRN